MREVKDIRTDLHNLEANISEMQTKRRKLMEELRDTLQQKFEIEKGVKDGDTITTINGKTFFYERFIIDAYGSILMLCHPAKNDGTASRQQRHMLPRDFDFDVYE
jgi:hypothetical protein